MTEKIAKGPVHDHIPKGDDRLRKVCFDCGYVAYENPKVVTGAVCTWENKILLCKRAIEPRKGYWTIPAGFLEQGETTEQGAIRETWEEATARIKITGLLGIYEIPHISQLYIVHRAEMTVPDFAPGTESEDVILTDYENIEWEKLAFASINWALEHFRNNTGPIITSHQS